MNSTKSIYTFRPYYIDVERLYDIYSTVMDGYTNTQETIEIAKNSTQKGKKVNGSGDFAITSLFKPSLKGSLSGEWNKTQDSENELQIKSTRKLSPCVLLNWMLGEMINDKRILETTTRWLHKPIILREHALGQPVILKGRICSNSVKTLQGLNVYPRGIKGIMKHLGDIFTDNVRRKLDIKKKFILVSGQSHLINSLFQQICLETKLLNDIYINIPQAELNQYNDFYSKLTPILKQLHTKLENDSYFQAINMTIDIDNYNNIVDSIDSLLNDFSDNVSIPNTAIVKPTQQLTKIKNAIEMYLEKLREQLNKNSPGGYGYTFDLREQMYYDASAADILNAPVIHCFGLIKNFGTYMYELEVIAIYQ